MPAAELGPENPLPPLHPPRSANAGFDPEENVPEELRRQLASECWTRSHVLPYGTRDGYSRELRNRRFEVAVLENRILRATFLLPLGGRLWSLFHKPSGEELLYVNPVIQFANLARRNAWFAGGVEWNASVEGHSPLTCEPLFAATINDPDRGPVLRQYEWDRIRGAVFQIDSYLPDDSHLLLVRVRIRNPRRGTIPAYWWSNIAVPEEKGSRVIVPAEHALHFSYRGRLRWTPVPEYKQLDVTYPGNIPSANDFFYYIAPGKRRWIASVNSSGSGLVQSSTSGLPGRKLFVWGQGPGGRRWQSFLSPEGGNYAELQAGLTLTQHTSAWFPPGTEWEWVEAYGRVCADPAVLHGKSWPAAAGEVESRLEELISEEQLESELKSTRNLAGSSPDEIIQHGSGWGALEELRRKHCGEQPLGDAATPFEKENIGYRQQPWASLLTSGCFPVRPVSETTSPWMVQEEWHKLLKQSACSPENDHWLTWLHLGVMEYARGNLEEAGKAWHESVDRDLNAWALRNLGILAQDNGDYEASARFLRDAVSLLPDEQHLLIECIQAMTGAGDAGKVLLMVQNLPARMLDHPRINQLLLRAALDSGDLDKAGLYLQKILDEEPVDVREGETSITELWYRYHELRAAGEHAKPVDEELRAEIRRNCPPPPRIDFRMFAPGNTGHERLKD
jgi:tetratricopeptide (TPR) repeat protein